jgi:hypothetical protein
VAELAGRAGVDARYAREWLEQQAVAGLLDVEDPARDAEDRRYRLPAAHADVLLDADHPAHAGATAWWMGSLARVLQWIPDLYRGGQGLPYPEYGADCRLAIANFNRPMFVNDLAGWFAAAPELEARLRSEGARALDVGGGRRGRLRRRLHVRGPARHGPAGRGPPGHPVPAGRRRGPGGGRREGRRDLHRPR